MKFSEPLIQLLAGLITLGISVIVFSYLSKPRKKETDILARAHTFGFYVFAAMLLIGGFILIGQGFKGVFLK